MRWLGSAPGSPRALSLGQEWHRQGQALLAQGKEQHSKGPARAHQPQPREAFPGWTGATHTAANLWGCQKNSKDTSERTSGKHLRTKALLFNSKFFSSPGPLWPLGTSCPWTHAASSGAAPQHHAEGWAALCCPGPQQAESQRRKSKGGRCKSGISALTALRLTQQRCFDSGKRRPAAPCVLFSPGAVRDGAPAALPARATQTCFSDPHAWKHLNFHSRVTRLLTKHNIKTKAPFLPKL